MTTGERIVKRRKELGLQQKDLAERMGVTAPTVSAYERDVKTPKLTTLQRFAAALHCSVSDLVDVEADTPTEEQPPAASPVERVGAAMNQLNATGQAVAADFVEGLAEVPKYQAQREKPPEGT